MKKDELCEESKEMKYEGEGIISGCNDDTKHENKKVISIVGNDSKKGCDSQE